LIIAGSGNPNLVQHCTLYGS